MKNFIRMPTLVMNNIIINIYIDELKCGLWASVWGHLDCQYLA